MRLKPVRLLDQKYRHVTIFTDSSVAAYIAIMLWKLEAKSQCLGSNIAETAVK